MIIGVETKIIIAYENEKVEKNEDVKNVKIKSNV